MSATKDYDGLCGIIHLYSGSQKQVRCHYEFGHWGPCSFAKEKVHLTISGPSFYERLYFELYGKKSKLKSKGWGPWKCEWYSICSMHYFHDEFCSMCQAGSWRNCYKHIIESHIFDKNPDLWRRWANDKSNPGLLVLIKHFLYGKVGFRKSY